jgi:hypothetical protein
MSAGKNCHNVREMAIGLSRATRFGQLWPPGSVSQLVAISHFDGRTSSIPSNPALPGASAARQSMPFGRRAARALRRSRMPASSMACWWRRARMMASISWRGLLERRSASIAVAYFATIAPASAFPRPKGEGPDDDRRQAPHARIALDDFREIVRPVRWRRRLLSSLRHDILSVGFAAARGARRLVASPRRVTSLPRAGPKKNQSPNRNWRPAQPSEANHFSRPPTPVQTAGLRPPPRRSRPAEADSLLS